MLLSLHDTIAALASPPGGALRGILRISGPQVVECLGRCFESTDGNVLTGIRAAQVVPGRLRLAAAPFFLPSQVYLWPTARSYTRQPVAEVHTLGSVPLLEAALDAIFAAGARPARPGEFTLRAFLAGRLDLTQAEAVLGVIDAEDQRQLRVALEQLAGGLTTPLNHLRGRLLDLLADLEAGLDFVEDDIQFIAPDQVCRQLSEAADQVDALLARMRERQQSRHEKRIVLRGWPNVGKSSLLNALAGRQAALVSDASGTTRDFVSCHVDIAGNSCLLIDTAGVECASADPLVAEAQAVGRHQQHQADLELLCLDASRPLNDWERQELAADAPPRRLLIFTKSDLVAGVSSSTTDLAGVLPASGHLPSAVWTSSTNGAGLDRLREAIGANLDTSAPADSHVVGTTAARCRESLRQTRIALRKSLRVARRGLGDELVAVELRTALDHLGQVVGAVYTDDVLDRIFSRFCIGK
jgi:tRNA modification GTPase